MKRSLLLLSMAVVSVYPSSSNASTEKNKAEIYRYSSPKACNKPDHTVRLTGKSCDNFVFDPVQISCLQPRDVQGNLRQANFNNRQRASDLFSWQTFVAINWPVSDKERGLPAADLPINAGRQRVWESWKDTDEIFLPDGMPPKSWNSGQQITATPKSCSTEYSNKILYRNHKVSGALGLNDSLQPTKTDGTLPGTLTGQNRQVVRYEIRYNKTAFEYIVSNKLYAAKQQNIVNSVNFPEGSILVKAAWLPLKNKKRAEHFQTAQACVCKPRKNANDPLTGCKDETVGLVGFHVMEKTKSAPQWIWSTFEQVDNVKSTSGIPASFNRKNCPSGKPSCAVNKQTQIGTPNQVERSIKIPETQSCKNDGATDNVVLLNNEIRAALASYNSTLQYYQLINSQWPNPPSVDSAVKPETIFQAIPSLLGNTTLETFVQPTSSCMGCHAMARSARLDQFVSADFTFTLDNALPKQNNPNLLPAPTKAAGSKVMHGFALMNNTFEMLPDKVSSKLHCSSCHLDAGRNPKASWLADMDSAYAVIEKDVAATDGSHSSSKGLDVFLESLEVILTYPESLYQRINGCMTRSMNGKPLCKTKTKDENVSNGDINECADDENMQGLVKYTEWLTTQRRVQFDSDSPRGFPQLSIKKSSVSNGKQTYMEKCAFCHGIDGQGLYENGAHPQQPGVYYRPALWGKNSYNACAGMARVDRTKDKGTHLAGFIKANMPLGSGGVLTDQEAWDLAAFINSHCRPGKAGCPDMQGDSQNSIEYCLNENETEKARRLTLPAKN